MIKQTYFFVLALLIIGCTPNTQYKTDLQDPELFQSAVKNLSDIIVYDIFSPPVASRVYMYPTIAAYEIIAQANSTQYKSLAALEAYQEKLEEKINDMGVPRSVRKASMVYAQSMADHILQWASKDMYNQTRTYPKYTILEGEKFWKPTPPDYMDGIEPHWNKIRTLVLDSANQFSPKPPLTFDLTKGSPFQTQLQEVYEVGDNLTEEQVEIAKFWDCNPYVTHHRGHAMFATKKITPGGHWIGITAIAARQAKSNFMETVNAFTHVSVALFDAFISCWDEKWNTLVVRPETLINKHYNEEWLPLLQTPPFPEYTSGHSVISRASAVVLTKLYGDNFAFKDTTEVAYGLPVRSFNSFIHASEEAAISRLYGGIHYMMAIEEGVAQGNKVGEHIAKRLQTQIAPTQLASTK